MTECLDVALVKQAHAQLIARSGGSLGVRDEGALSSALAQPLMTFGGTDLYPTLWEKAAALGFSLIQNHPFVDGNKRIAHAAMEIFLVANGYELGATTDDQERVILAVAAGEMEREEFAAWVEGSVRPLAA
jgi:death-on-curing protein